VATTDIGLHEIASARERIRGRVVETPCAPADALGERFGGELWFKFENLQRTGSFKERGALNRLLALSEEERRRGVIAASAGNHAQGVAYHAGRLGVPATIVMPERTPLIKVSNTERFGATVVLHGASYDDAMTEARRRGEAGALQMIHPFDDPLVIAGQGTIGLELLEQVPNVDVVVVPVGGGGLIAGIASAVKQRRPEVRIVGVEAASLPAAGAARAAGEPVVIPPGETIADGIAVRRIGSLTFELIERYVDDLVTVDEEEIASAILHLIEREKTVVEGAGAVGLAAVLHGRVRDLGGRCVVVPLSGGNIDLNLISRIIERGLIMDGRQTRLSVRLPDRPGALAALTARVAETGANILDLEHRRGMVGLALTEASVVLMLETRGREHAAEIVERLRRQGYDVHG
jgi:threonine dehydratase